MSTITIGVDLAKSVFSVCEIDSSGHVRRRLDFKRDAFAVWLVQLPTGTTVAMEVCSGAHYWARHCLEYGLQLRIIAAPFVTPFRKSSRTKHDRADAEAIVPAARQGNMRFVPVKSVDQLPWRCVSAHAADPGRAQQPAAGQGHHPRKGDAGTSVDTLA